MNKLPFPKQDSVREDLKINIDDNMFILKTEVSPSNGDMQKSSSRATTT